MSNVPIMIEAFLDYMRHELNRSEQTVNSYAHDLKEFDEYLDSLPEPISWESVDTDIIRNWVEYMMDKGNRATSVNRRLSALRSLYRFALARHLVEKDPAYRVTGPKNDKPLPQFLKEKEMDELLDRQQWGDDYKDVRTRTIIMAFYETGMRLSELIGLDDGVINFVSRELKVLGKGNKERIIPFGNELDAALREYIKVRNLHVERKSSALFLSDKGSRMKPQAVRTIVQKALSGVSALKKKSPHVLRHTFATAMLNHHAGIESLKRLLGHASVSTTEIYTHTTFEQLKRVYNEAHPRA